MVYIVVPAYNEEKNIGRVIRDLFQHGYENVVVVDDGSTDNTFEEAKQAGARVLKHEVNRGQGAALQTGDEFALQSGADLVVHFDADGQFKADDIASAIEVLYKNNLDAVLGSRFLDNRTKLPFLKKYLVFPMAKIINRIFTGVKLTDVHNGFRILNRRALEKIVITQDKMAHNSEIISQLKKNNLKFMEAPVEVVYHEFGQGIGGGFKILKDLLLALLIK